jgi:regulator of sirC expression with transglutaminase-like and TPR domain
MTGYEGQQTKCYDGNAWSLAFALRIEFRDQFIASAPRSGTAISFVELDAWFRAHINPELIHQYSLSREE